MIRLKGAWPLIFRTAIFISCLTLSILIGQRAAIRRFTLSANQPENTILDHTILIPAGKFIMGSDTGRVDEAPSHQVYLDAFWIDQFEVTNWEYHKFILETGISPPRYWVNWRYPIDQDLYPVVGVRWKDAQAYCEWRGKRLPTEAEWEKACRGTDGLIYPWGDFPNHQKANVSYPPEGPQPGMWDDSWDLLITSPGLDSPSLMPVGSYPDGASPYGIYDLVGNASEWVADYYNWQGYGEVSTSNPLVLEPPWNHVIRGSAWLMPYGGLLGGHDTNRCSARSSSHGDTRDARTGFRCALSID